MNVDGRWRISVVGGRVVAAGVVLLATGCAVLGIGFRPRQGMVNVAPSSAEVTVSSVLAPSQPAEAQVSAEAHVHAHSLLAGLPLMFEPNQGQANLDPADARAKFVARGSQYSIFLGSQGAILSLSSKVQSKTKSGKQDEDQVRVTSIGMKLAGANPNPNIRALEPLPGKTNYFIGNDRAKWRAGVPQFARVSYDDVYPGINLVFYGNQGHLEYDFKVAPGSDPTAAEVEFEGARKLALRNGNLVIENEGGDVQLEAPRVYQEIDGRQQPVEGKFVLRGSNRAGFAIGSYDRSRELIIDPIVNFSTFFGGSLDERGTTVAVDGSFNIYITGSTASPDIPATPGVFQGTRNGTQNVFVAKITPPLSAVPAVLDYATYIGGNGIDTPIGIKVDGAGDAFVVGSTSSTNFPATQTAYQATPLTTGTHVFVSELNGGPTPAAASTLLYSTYLSGNGTQDLATGMTIDAAGDVYVTGTTNSNNTADVSSGIQFPASNIGVVGQQGSGQAFQPSSLSAIQFFVSVVNTAAAGVESVLYSTYFGGAVFTPPSGTTLPTAVGGGIAVDTSNNIYFSGTTNFQYRGCSGCSAGDFPILNAYQPCLDQPQKTTYVNPIVCDYTGGTGGTPTDTTVSDAFAAKLSVFNKAPGQQLQWSTYLGGSGTDSSTGIGLDPGAGNVYLVGTTNSADIATGVNTLSTSAAYQPCLDQPGVAQGACSAATGSPNDAFVGRLSNPTNATGTPINGALNYFSYLGGSADEAGLAITVDTNSGALVTGWTQSTNFPVSPPNSIQSALTGFQDAFMARLNTAAVIGQATSASWSNYFGGITPDAGSTSAITSGTGITLDVNQNAYIAGETNTTDLAHPKALYGSNAGGYDAFVTQLGTALSMSINGVLTLGNNQVYISAGNQATFTYTITNNGPDLATNISVTDNFNPAVTSIPLTFVSATASTGTCGGATTGYVVSCSLGSLQAGSTATVVIVVVPNANASGTSPQSFNGGTVQVTAPGNIVLASTSVPAAMSDYNMFISPFNQTVTAGNTASYQIQLTPHPLYVQNITLSCAAPQGLTGTQCNFSPQSSVALQSTSGATITMNITTTVRPIVIPTTIFFSRFFFATWLAFPGLAIVSLGFKGQRRRRIMGITLLGWMLFSLVLLPACSKAVVQPPVSGTQAGSFNILVTAASGSDSKTLSVGLNVQ